MGEVCWVCYTFLYELGAMKSVAASFDVPTAGDVAMTTKRRGSAGNGSGSGGRQIAGTSQVLSVSEGNSKYGIAAIGSGASVNGGGSNGGTGNKSTATSNGGNRLVAMLGTMMRAQSGEQTTAGPSREAVAAAVSVAAATHAPPVAQNLAIKLLAADALSADHAEEVRPTMQRRDSSSLARTNASHGAQSSVDAVFDAMVSRLNASNVNGADVMLVCEAPLPVLRKLLGEEAMKENTQAAGAGAGGATEAADAALLERESLLFRCSDTGPDAPGVAQAACLAISRSLLRDDISAAASVYGPLRRCVIAHWRRLAKLASIQANINVDSAETTDNAEENMSPRAIVSSTVLSKEEHVSTIGAAAFSGIAALLRPQKREWEVHEEAVHAVAAHFAMYWDSACSAALAPAITRIQDARTQNVLALAQCVHLVASLGGDEMQRNIDMEQTVAMFTPVLHDSMSSFSPLRVETAAEAVLTLSEVSQGGDLPTMTVAAIQALFSLWDRVGCASARTSLILRIANATSRLPPAASSASISKCINLVRSIPGRKDKLQCLHPLCDAALKLAKWNVMACRRGLYRPHDVKVDLQILNSDSVMRESPFREELFASLIHAAFLSLKREFSRERAGRARATEASIPQSPEETDMQLEWLAVFTQAIELVACSLHWDVNPLSRALHGLWFKFVVKVLRACKDMHIVGGSTASTIATQLQRRIHTVLRTLLSSVNTIKNFTLKLQIFWCVGCHIQLDGDDASDIASSLIEKLSEILHAVAVGKLESRLAVQSAAARRGSIAASTSGSIDDSLSPLEVFAVEIAFAVLQRLWLIGSPLTKTFLAKALGNDGPVDRLGRSARVDAALKDRCWRVLQLAYTSPAQASSATHADNLTPPSLWPDETSARRIFGADGCSFGDDDSMPFDGINPTSSRANYMDANSGTKAAYNFLSMLGGGMSFTNGTGDVSAQNVAEDASVCGALTDMTGASDPISIRGEHHMSGSATNLVLTFRITNQSVMTLPEITLSAMLYGPVSFCSASQRQSCCLVGLRRGESRDWRIPVVVNGLARSSVVIEVIAKLDDDGGNGGAPLTMRSQAYHLPLAAALRYPRAAPLADPSAFYVRWAALPFRTQKRAQVITDLSKLGRMRKSSDAREALFALICSELENLPMQLVCAESFPDYGSSRACYQAETTGGDTVSMIVEGLTSIDSGCNGDIQGIITLSVRSTSCDVVSSVDDTTEFWFDALLPNTEHKIIGIPSKTTAVREEHAVSASSVVDITATSKHGASKQGLVSVQDMNSAILDAWRLANTEL